MRVGGHRNLPARGHHVATTVMTEGERSLGSFPPWESPQLWLSAAGLSTRYPSQYTKSTAPSFTLVERGARTYRGKCVRLAFLATASVHHCPMDALTARFVAPFYLRVLHGNLVAPRSEDEEAGLITEMKSVSCDVTVEICRGSEPISLRSRPTSLSSR